MRSAAATLSGVSLMVRALAPGTGATRRAPRTTRRRSIVSLRSAFERKSVLTTCCSNSRRFVAVSGTTFRIFASTTRWKVRPAAASAFRAWSKPTSRRSRLTVESWNEGSNVTLTPAARPRARYASRRLAPRNTRPSGCCASGPRSSPGSALSRARTFASCTEETPFRRRTSRSRISSVTSAASGFSSSARRYSSRASLYSPRPASRRPMLVWSVEARWRARSRARRYCTLSGDAFTAFWYSSTARS